MKAKFALKQTMKAKRGSTVIVILFNLSALDGVGWLTPESGRFNPGKETRYPLYKRLGRSQRRSAWVRKISPPMEFDPRTVQPAASRYPGPCR